MKKIILLCLLLCATTLSAMQKKSYVQLIEYIKDYERKVNDSTLYNLKYNNALHGLGRFNTPDYKKAPNGKILEQLLEKFKGIQNVSQQDIANVVGFSHEKCLYDVTYVLIELWQNDIDINLTSDTFYGTWVAKDIVDTQIDIVRDDCVLKFTNSKEFIDDHTRLYNFVSKKFKNSIYTINGSETARKNFHIHKIIRKIINSDTYEADTSKNLTLFLIDFLETFQTDIDFLTKDESERNILDICSIREEDSHECKEHKASILAILKKYSRKKPKLSPKLNNCFFTYIIYYDNNN